MVCCRDQEKIDAASQQCLVHIGRDNLAPIGTSLRITETENGQCRKYNKSSVV